MANTSKNSLGYRINYREGTISVSERLIKEANREGIGSVAHTTLEALMKMGMPIVKYRENTTTRKGLTYLKRDVEQLMTLDHSFLKICGAWVNGENDSDEKWRGWGQKTE